MKNHIRSCLLILTIAGLSFISCDKEEDDGYNFPEATLTQDGFDFSLGNKGDLNTYDGLTADWCPGGINPNYPDDDIYIWWNNGNLNPQYGLNQTKDMGNVGIETVKEAPSAWDPDPDINPLLKGHTIVAKCFDGYVKFEVISASSSGNCPAQVKYYFSTTVNFDK